MSAAARLAFEDVAVRARRRAPCCAASTLALARRRGAAASPGRTAPARRRCSASRPRVLRPSAGAVRARAARRSPRFARRELARRIAVVPQDVGDRRSRSRAGEVVLMGRAPHLGRLGFETAADVARARACARARSASRRSPTARCSSSRAASASSCCVARALAQDAARAAARRADRAPRPAPPRARARLRARAGARGPRARSSSRTISASPRATANRLALLAEGRIARRRRAARGAPARRSCAPPSGSTREVLDDSDGALASCGWPRTSLAPLAARWAHASLLGSRAFSASEVP